MSMARSPASRLRVLRWGRQGSNLRPKDYESPALTTELRPQRIMTQAGLGRLRPGANDRQALLVRRPAPVTSLWHRLRRESPVGGPGGSRGIGEPPGAVSNPGARQPHPKRGLAE